MLKEVLWGKPGSPNPELAGRGERNQLPQTGVWGYLKGFSPTDGHCSWGERRGTELPQAGVMWQTGHQASITVLARGHQGPSGSNHSYFTDGEVEALRS